MLDEELMRRAIEIAGRGVGAEKAIWVGHDWGSPVVWNVAAHHPDLSRELRELWAAVQIVDVLTPRDSTRGAFRAKPCARDTSFCARDHVNATTRPVRLCCAGTADPLSAHT